MRWKCNRCRHEWDENITGSAIMVQCPECFSAMPLNLATSAGKAAAEAPTVPALASPAGVQPEAMDISDADTIMESGLVASLSRRNADPSATATVSPFDQTLPAAPLSEPEDSLFEMRDTMQLSGGETAVEAGLQRTRIAPERTAPPEDDMDSEETAGGPGPDSAPTKAFAMASPKEIDLSGQTVGGYRVSKMLGAGGMGAVCLARQVSLDRDVALKILPGRLAQNPEFLVRFTREALSAAQLCHHNVIQVYDVGSAGDVHYIAMEFVRGENLGDMVRRDGPLRAEDAASFALQAARGLKYAHDLGIVHRDIKPDNLMVNEHGILKLADMGLAKMRGVAEQTIRTGDSMPSLLARAKGDLTMVDVAMGTPAYMPPEQARDASSVDHRADQYSLGCTLYYLVSGEPPYSGSSAYEIISKHMESPPPALEEKVRNVPGVLAAIVRRMLAKEPDDRYPSMIPVIEDLEAVLGVEAEKGPYTPREHHLELLEREQIRYYSASSLKWRKLAPIGFFAATVVAAAACVFSGELGMAGGFLGLLFLTPLASFVIGGITQKTYLFRRVRSVFFGMPVREWILVVAGLALAVAVLTTLGLVWWWAAFSVLAVALAATYQWGIVRLVNLQRANPLGAVQEMLKHLRLRGLSEDAIQEFIYRFSAEHWEEMFEALFGYEAMLDARSHVSATDHLVKRKRHAVWREPILRWLDGVEDARRIAREKRHFAKVETGRLKAQGATERDAKRRAKAAAVKMHAELKVEEKRTRTVETKSKKEARAPRPSRQLTPADNAFRAVRFAFGAAVLLLFACHMFGNVAPAALQSVMYRIVTLPVPEALRQMMLGYWGGAAGLALVISAFSVHRLTGALVLLGATAIIAAQYIHPVVSSTGLLEDVGQFLQASAALAGVGIAISIFHTMAGRKF